METFLRICTGTLYAGNLGHLAPGELAQEVVAYLVLAREQLGVVLVGLAGLAVVRLASEGEPRLARYPAVLLVSNVGFFLFYNALEKDTMYVPSFVALLVLGLTATRELWGHVMLRRSAALALGLLALWTGFSNGPRIDRRDYHEVRRAVDSTARLLPPRANFYLTDDLIIHPFLYVMILEGVRQDVQVQIVDGFGDAVKKGLAERLARGETVFSTLFYPEATFQEVAAEFRLMPRGFLYEVRRDAPPALPRMTGGHPGDLAGARVVGTGVFPPRRMVRRSDQLQVAITWDLKEARDPAAVFSWKPPGLASELVWVHRIGYQGRPRVNGELTEEYLLKVPWTVPQPVGGKAALRVRVVPSIADAVASGELSVGNTRDWKERVFFKAYSAGFVRAIERGWPVFAEVLSLSGSTGQQLERQQLERQDPERKSLERQGPDLDLGPVELVWEVER